MVRMLGRRKLLIRTICPYQRLHLPKWQHSKQIWTMAIIIRRYNVMEISSKQTGTKGEYIGLRQESIGHQRRHIFKHFNIKTRASRVTWPSADLAWKKMADNVEAVVDLIVQHDYAYPAAKKELRPLKNFNSSKLY